MAANGEKYLLYHYNPSLAAAVVFIVLFIGTTAAHLYQLLKKRTWYFIPFLIGGFFEWIGYIGRAIAAKESPNWTVGPYIQQSLLLLLAPALFAASIYMILGRIILLTDGEKHSIIRRKWLTKFFVAGDVLSFLMQSAGGGMLAKAKTSDSVKMGENIITGGLVVQLLFFGFFIVVAGVFHYRIAMLPTARCQTVDVPWARYLWVLYIASVLIMIRSVFRVIEYVQGQDGELLSTEIYLYIFDASLMFLTMLLFNVYHPSRIISKEHLYASDSEQGAEMGGGGYTMPEQNRRRSAEKRSRSHWRH